MTTIKVMKRPIKKEHKTTSTNCGNTEKRQGKIGCGSRVNKHV